MVERVLSRLNAKVEQTERGEAGYKLTVGFGIRIKNFMREISASCIINTIKIKL